MKKYQRLVKNSLNRLSESKTDKIIAILGARQVGKTTFLMDFTARWNGKLIKYLGDKLEDAAVWRGEFNVLKNNIELKLGIPLEKLNEPCLLVFDEIQKVPEAFNNLKILNDQFKEKIKIAISGSSSLRLLHRTTESLGGRVEIVTMYPLSFTEILSDSPEPLWIKKSVNNFDSIKSDILAKSKIGTDAEKSLKKALSFGFFPEAYLQENIEEVKILYQNYHQTYIEKDVRDLREVGNILDFDMIWKIANRNNGQMINYSNVSMESGLSFNTVKKYIAVLNACFNIFMLFPFTKNIRKRIVRSPKIFSLDIGFFNHCTGLYGEEMFKASQLIGRVFESVMVLEFLKQEKSFLIGGEPYFYRTSAGAEVDLVVERGLDVFAYEFKYSEKITASDFTGIKSLEACKNVKAGFVVSRQPYPEKFGENLFAVPWWYFCT